MNRPWKIWLAFALCAGLTLAAMAWLTREAVRADLDRTKANQQAELEQQVSLVLWRMDTKLAPLIAEEVARPPEFFRGYENAQRSNQGQTNESASELSGARADLPKNVLLNFSWQPPGNWTSPQVPNNEWDTRNSATGQILDAKQDRLAQLSRQILPEELLKQLPEQMIAASQAPARSATDESFYAPNSAPSKAATEAGPQSKSLDLEQRGKRYQDVAQQEFRKQRAEPANSQAQPAPAETQAPLQAGGQLNAQPQVAEGLSRPICIGENLLLARRVVRNGETSIQGTWLDWPSIRTELLAEAKDIFPDASLSPVHDAAKEDPTRMLAGLPVLFDPGVKLVALHLSPPMKWALALGWGALALALASSAILLAGVVALSERRAAFVSSVTHELRTPLTTFRMYSDMLARGMVPEGSRRQEYLETLRREAERLTHLVENVLSYARLERGRAVNRHELVTVDGLIDRYKNRLAERAEQAGMELVVSVADGAGKCQLQTDVGVVEQILFNLVDNASKYAQTAEDRRIHFEVSRNTAHVAFTIRDHGPGFTKSKHARSAQPFSKTAEEAAVTAPGVGLGLALCRRLAKQLGGRLEINSHTAGAEVTLTLPARAS